MTSTPGTPGLWARLQLRWRIWRRNPALMEDIARQALLRTGVCDDSDSLIRLAWDKETGHLIVMVYLAHFDHAAWIMSRHIEGYLMRQYKGIFGISVHSVHIDVIRSRAFKEMPPIKSASSLRAVLRQRRGSEIKSTGTTGRKIGHVHSQPQKLDADNFPATGHMGLEQPSATSRSVPDKKPAADPAMSRTRSPIVASLITDEYLSVPGYEISEVNFDEFLNSMPGGNSSLPPGFGGPPPVGSQKPPSAAPRPGSDGKFVAEADLMKRDRE